MVRLKSILRNGFLACLAFIVAIFCAEGLARLLMPKSMVGACFEMTDKGLIVNRSEGSTQHRYANTVVDYNFFEPHLRDTPIGRRGIKVLTVGDSFTFGYMLSKEDMPVHILQRYADEEFGKNTFQFLNAAVSGWGTSDYVAFVEDFGDIIKPGIILVFVNIYDVGRSLRGSHFFLSEDVEGALIRRFLPVPVFIKATKLFPGYEWFINHSYLLQFMRQCISRLTAKKIDTRIDALKLSKALFLRLKKWCDERGVVLYVATTGWVNHKPGELALDSKYTDEFLLAAKDFFREQGIPFFDASPYVSKTLKKQPDFYIFNEGHPNKQGGRLFVRVAWDHLVKYQLRKFCQENNLIAEPR